MRRRAVAAASGAVNASTGSNDAVNGGGGEEQTGWNWRSSDTSDQQQQQEQQQQHQHHLTINTESMGNSSGGISGSVHRMTVGLESHINSEFAPVSQLCTCLALTATEASLRTNSCLYCYLAKIAASSEHRRKLQFGR
jgi:hypothetical protein